MAGLIAAIGRALYSAKSRGLPKRVGKILFFKTGALGDVIMTTPLVRVIRQRFPQATIDYACGRSFAPALKGNRNINYIIEFDENIFFRNKLKELRKLARRLRENSYDIVFVLDRHWAAGVFASLAGRFRIGFDRNGEGFANNLNVMYRQNKHDIDAYLDMAIFFRAKTTDRSPDLPISKKDRDYAKRVCPKNAAAIAPGGGANTGQAARIKLWPKENYLAVVDRLSKRHNIVLVGGENDRNICSWIRHHAKNKKRVKNLCGKTTVAQTGAVLELCRFVICNDSGAMHIASCVNDNIISLFGPTNPHVLAPLNSGSTYIWKEEKPCYDIYGRFDKCPRGVMKKIQLEDVLNAAKRYGRN